MSLSVCVCVFTRPKCKQMQHALSSHLLVLASTHVSARYRHFPTEHKDPAGLNPTEQGLAVLQSKDREAQGDSWL